MCSNFQQGHKQDEDMAVMDMEDDAVVVEDPSAQMVTIPATSSFPVNPDVTWCHSIAYLLEPLEGFDGQEPRLLCDQKTFCQGCSN